MGEHEGAGHFFVGVVVLLGEDHHGVGGADALVARTGVAHHGYHGAGHAGIAGTGGGGEDVGENVVAHDAAAQGTRECLAQAVPVVALERTFGCGLVEAAGLVDEGDFFERHCGGILPDLAERERVAEGLHALGTVVLAAAFAAVLLVEEYFPVVGEVAEVGVLARNGGRGGVAVGRADAYVHVEFAGGIFRERYVDAAAVDVLLALFDGFGGDTREAFEFLLGTADECAEGDGDGEAHHAGAGDAYAHGVFQHVGTEADFDALGKAAQKLGGTAHGEGYADGFGAADGGNNPVVYEGSDLLFFSRS